MRIVALCLLLSNLLLMTGCGGSAPAQNQANLPPVDDSRATAGAPGRPGQPVPVPAKTGMSTTKKVVLLAGAAALFYLYEHHKNAPANATGENSQYYLSKNGRVYYRDAQHRAHYVTAPSAGIPVPAADAEKYQQYKGYDNKTDGKDLTGVGADKDE